MRPRLRVVSPQEVAVVPWYRERWVVIAAAVLWWIATYLFWLAVAVVITAVFLFGLVLTLVGVMAHFVGESR
jgi:hypothetical protein